MCACACVFKRERGRDTTEGGMSNTNSIPMFLLPQPAALKHCVLVFCVTHRSQVTNAPREKAREIIAANIKYLYTLNKQVLVLFSSLYINTIMITIFMPQSNH